MENFIKLIRENEDWLLKRILKYAIERGYSKYTSTMEEAWRASIVGLSESIILGYKKSNKAAEFSPEEDLADDPITQFAVSQSIKHRQRGTTLSMFLGLIKYYRQCYIDLFCIADITEKEKAWVQKFLIRAFDKFEIGFCSEWLKTKEEKRFKELQETTRTITNEKKTYLTVFESISDPVILLNKEFKIVSINYAAFDLIKKVNAAQEIHTSLKRENIINNEILSYFPWLKKIKEITIDGAFNKTLFQTEFKLGDSRKFFEVSITKMLDVSETYTEFIVTLRDVTEYRIYLESLKYRSLILDSINDSIVLLDKENKITEWNKGAEKLSGYSREEAIGKPIEFILLANFISEKIPLIRKKIEEEGIWQGEISGVNIKGEYFYHSSTILPVTNESGEILSYLIVSRDLEEVKKSELHLKSIIENTDASIWLVNSDYKLLKFNSVFKEAFYNAYGIELKKDLNIVDELSKTNKTLADEWKIRYNKALKGETFSLTDVFDFGKKLYIQSTFRPIIENDNVVGVSVFSESITDKKIAEEQLKRSEERYRLLFEEASDAILIMEDFTIVDCNNKVLEFLKLSKEDVIGKTPYDISPELQPSGKKSSELAQEIMDSVLNGGNKIFEWSHLTKDNEEIIFEINLTKLGMEYGSLRSIAFWRDLTDRKQAEEALKVSENRYRELFETMAQGVVYQNAEGNIIRANPAAEKLLGLSLDQMMGRTSLDPRWHTIHEDGAPFPGNEHPAMISLKTGKNVNNVIIGVYNPQEGDHNWIKVNSVPQFKQGEDKPYQVYATLDDITDIILAEKALKFSEEKYRTLFEHMNEGFALHEMIFDDEAKPIDYIFLEVNPAFEYLTALKRKDIIGKKVTEVIPTIKEEKVDWIGIYGKVVKTGKAIKFEDRSEALKKWFQINAFSPQKDTFAVVLSDITERKEVQQALQDSERRLSFALKSTISGQFEYNLKTGYLEWDDRSCEIFGITLEDFNNDYKSWRKLVYPEDINNAEEGLNKALNDLDEHILNLEYRVLFNENMKYVNATGYIERDENRKAILIHGLHFDITERKLSEKKLRNLAINQETLLREVNHRVKNNLAALLSIIYKEWEKAEHLGMVNLSPIMKDLISRVKGLSTVHTMLSASGWRPLKCSSLCEKVVFETFRGISSSCRADLKVKTSNLHVESNVAHNLTLILNELATNSIKHCNCNDKKLKVDIEIQNENEDVTITYKDNGPGYPKSIINKDYSGTSIGFNLIKGISEQSLAGNIEFSNQNGAVTKISFKIL